LVTQGVPKEALRSSHAILEIPEEQFENVFSVTLVDSDVDTGRSKVRLETGEELFIPYVAQPPGPLFQIRISADDIIVATQNPEGTSAGNVLPGIIRRIEMREGQALLMVLAGQEFYVNVTAAAVKKLGLVVDCPVFLIMKARSFRLL